MGIGESRVLLLNTYLEWIIVKNVAHHRSRAQIDAFHAEWRYGRPRLEHVRVIAHLSQLHQHIDYIQEVARFQCLPGLGSAHEIVVEKTLTLRQATHHHVFVLLRHLFFHFTLQSTQQEWT